MSSGFRIVELNGAVIAAWLKYTDSKAKAEAAHRHGTIGDLAAARLVQGIARHEFIARLREYEGLAPTNLEYAVQKELAA